MVGLATWDAARGSREHPIDSFPGPKGRDTHATRLDGSAAELSLAHVAHAPSRPRGARAHYKYGSDDY
jgi:hypothetical protein